MASLCIETELLLEIEYDYVPSDPGKTSGDPEYCYPPSDAELEINSVTYNGKEITLTEADEENLSEYIQEHIESECE